MIITRKERHRLKLESLFVCICADGYKYTRHLLKMDRRKSGVRLLQLPAELHKIKTPSRVEEREKCQRSHPDRKFCEYLLHGMRRGFRIGLQYSCSCTSAKWNMKSALENPEVLDVCQKSYN